jgi:hypothetical protein
MSTQGIATATGLSVATGSMGVITPVPTDYVAIYRLDGTDSISRVGGDDFRLGKECDVPKCSMFDGSTQYYNADADASIFNGLQTGFSVSFWVNISGNGTDKEIIGVGSSAAGNDGFYIRVLASGVIQVASNGSFTNSTGTVNNGKWRHVVVQYTGTDRKWYIDGVLDTTTTSTFNTLAPSTFKIGVNSFVSSAWMNGMIDNVRVYDRILTDPEIMALCMNTCDYRPEMDDSGAIGVWNAQDQTTITTVTGVSQWDNLVAGGVHLKQATANNQPSASNTNTNNIFYIENDNSVNKQYFKTDPNAFDIGTSGELTVVHDMNIISNADLQSAIWNANATNPLLFSSNNAAAFDGQLRSNNLAVANVSATSPPYTGFHMWSAVVSKGGSGNQNLLELFHNGTSQGQTGPGNTNNLTQLQTLAVFVRELGERVLTAGMSNIFISASTDQATRQKLEGVVAWRNGAQASLPGGHPYQTVPPERG